MSRTNLSGLWLTRLPVTPSQQNQLSTKLAEHDAALDRLDGTGDLTADPRFDSGLAGDIGTTRIRVDGGLKQRFLKWGSGNTDWRLISPLSILQAQTAADVSEVFYEAITECSYNQTPLPASAAKLTPTHLWIPRPAVTDSVADLAADLEDLVGTAHLEARNGYARRTHLSLGGQEVVARTLQNAAGWGVDATTGIGQLNFGSGSWAFAIIFRVLSTPGGGANWILSRGDAGAGVGTYAIGVGTDGQAFFYAKDTAGVEVGSGGTDFTSGSVSFKARDSGTIVDDSWHIAIGGMHRGLVLAATPFARLILDCNGWETGYSDGSASTPALSGSFGSVANASALFGLHDGRNGTSPAHLAGANAQYAFLAAFEGEQAEYVLTHSTAICDGMYGALAI
jgi:hypothetical protein